MARLLTNDLLNILPSVEELLFDWSDVIYKHFFMDGWDYYVIAYNLETGEFFWILNDWFEIEWAYKALSDIEGTNIVDDISWDEVSINNFWIDNEEIWNFIKEGF